MDLDPNLEDRRNERTKAFGAVEGLGIDVDGDHGRDLLLRLRLDHLRAVILLHILDLIFC